MYTMVLMMSMAGSGDVASFGGGLFNRDKGCNGCNGVVVAASCSGYTAGYNTGCSGYSTGCSGYYTGCQGNSCDGGSKGGFLGLRNRDKSGGGFLGHRNKKGCQGSSCYGHVTSYGCSGYATPSYGYGCSGYVTPSYGCSGYVAPACNTCGVPAPCDGCPTISTGCAGVIISPAIGGEVQTMPVVPMSEGGTIDDNKKNKNDNKKDAPSIDSKKPTGV